MPTHPVETPITGREPEGDPRDPVQALRQFYRAFNTRDLAMMAENWLGSETVAMDNPLGGIRRGWGEIRSLYQRLFDGSGRVQVEFHDYTLHVGGEVFYAVGRERGTFEDGGTTIALAIRTSRVFRLLDGRWRQMHHHGSIDDPKLLSAYQQAVTAGERRSTPARP